MKIVYMGTPDFAVAPLEAIIRAGHEVTAVVTQPDKQKGRGKEVQMTPVKECALRHGIPVFQPVKIKEPEAVSKLREYSADIFVVAAFGQLLSEEILTMPKFGCINIHASLLPAYRGAAPIQWVILNGEKETGVTIQQMAKGLDTGDMLLKETVVLDEKETGGSLFDRLSDVGAQLLIKTLEVLENGTVTPEKQPAESPTPYAAMLTKKQGEIDWNQDAKKIECLIRGLNPWPSAYTHYRGKTLKIWDAQVEKEASEEKAQPGTAVRVTKNELVIQPGSGLLSLKEVQLEGKKRMAVDAFLRGYPVECGECFGGGREE